MSCLLCQRGCAHCRCEQAWSEVQQLAVGYGDEVRDGAEATSMIREMLDDCYSRTEAIEEKGATMSEYELEAHRELLDWYCHLAKLHKRIEASINAGVLKWRR